MYFLPIVILAFVLYFMNKRRILFKQADLLNKLLYIEKSPEKYIEVTDKLLLKIQSEREKNINLIQKTTGLFYAGRFEEAINILKNEISKIPPDWQVIYYHNLILSLFFSEKIEEEMKLFAEAKETIDTYYSKNFNKSAIELLYAVVDFSSGNISKSQETFIDLTKNGKNDYRIAMGYYFLGKIYDMEDRVDESEDNLEKAKMFGQGSFIEHL